MNYFDGVSFQNIYPTDFDKAHLHSDGVVQIGENADGNILFTTDDGIEEYNWKTKMLRLIFPSSMNGRTYQFKIDKQKNIWLLSEKYLQQYNSRFKLFKKISLDTLKNEMGYVNFCCIDNTNNIWFTYHDILCEWNTSKNTLDSKYNGKDYKYRKK